MTTEFVYPRLPDDIASTQVVRIRDAFESDGLKAVSQLARPHHPDAIPIATGGNPADEDQIQHVRNTVITSLRHWLEQNHLKRSEKGSFDLTLGEVLHEVLGIIPGDAAHEGTWNFLGLVVLPDVVVFRFPSLHPDRVFGGERNVLRSAWIRRDIFGNINDEYQKPLRVDEMVQLLERSELARNRPLIRAVARIVMEHEGPRRSDFARGILIKIRHATGPFLLDGLDEQESMALIKSKGWTDV